MTKTIVTVDIGGTNIRFKTFVLHEDKISSSETLSFETGILKEGKKEEFADNFADFVAEQIQVSLNNYSEVSVKPDAIGIASAGIVNAQTGVIENANFIKDLIGERFFKPVPLAEKIGKRFPGIPICVENDAASAVRGEAYFGIGQPWSDEQHRKQILLYLTISTGIGGAAWFNGQPFLMEPGSLILCTPRVTGTKVESIYPDCKHREKIDGAWSGLGSGKKIPNFIRAWLAHHGEDQTALFAEEDFSAIPEQLFSVGNPDNSAKDDLAVLCAEQLAYLAAAGMANLICIFGPNAPMQDNGKRPISIIVGGSVLSKNEWFVNRIENILLENFLMDGMEPTIRLTDLQGDNVLWGCLAHARQKLNAKDFDESRDS